MNPARYVDQSEDFLNRRVLSWRAAKAMGVNADATNASEATRDIVGQEFEILGTNAVSADCTLDTLGGVKIATHAGSADSTILLPHLTTSMSAWTTQLWDTAKSPTFDLVIRTGSVITKAKYWMGFKLTNTPTIATDADQVMFTYSTTVAPGLWQYNYSIAGTAVAVSAPAQIPAVAASTKYQLRIEVYSDRTHMGFVNGRPIAAQPFPALTSLTTLIPYCGVLSLTDAVLKSYTIQNYECTLAF